MSKTAKNSGLGDDVGLKCDLFDVEQGLGFFICEMRNVIIGGKKNLAE